MKLNFAFLSNGLLNDAVYERTEPLLVQTYMHTQLCTYIHIDIRVFTYSPHFMPTPLVYELMLIFVVVTLSHTSPYYNASRQVTSVRHNVAAMY